MVRIKSMMMALAALGLLFGTAHAAPKKEKKAEMGMLETRTTEGKVIRAERNELYIEANGMAIPFKVEKDTVIQGPGVTHLKDLKEGQEVRASYVLKGEKNLLRRVEVSAPGAMPGMQPPAGTPPGQPPTEQPQQ